MPGDRHAGVDTQASAGRRLGCVPQRRPHRHAEARGCPGRRERTFAGRRMLTRPSGPTKAWHPTSIGSRCWVPWRRPRRHAGTGACLGRWERIFAGRRMLTAAHAAKSMAPDRRPLVAQGADTRNALPGRDFHARISALGSRCWVPWRRPRRPNGALVISQGA